MWSMCSRQLTALRQGITKAVGSPKPPPPNPSHLEGRGQRFLARALAWGKRVADGIRTLVVSPLAQVVLNPTKICRAEAKNAPFVRLFAIADQSYRRATTLPKIWFRYSAMRELLEGGRPARGGNYQPASFAKICGRFDVARDYAAWPV